jgi:hypothetical protein
MYLIQNHARPPHEPPTLQLFVALPVLLLVDIILLSSGGGGAGSSSSSHAIRRTSRWFRDFYLNNVDSDPLTCARFLSLRLQAYPLTYGRGAFLRGSCVSKTLAYLYEQYHESFPVILDNIFRLLLATSSASEPEQDLNRYKKWLLAWAATKGYADVVDQLVLDLDADLDNALMWASSNGHTGAVELLLDQGADTDPDGYQYAPIVWASKNGHTDTVEVLLDKGSDVQAQDNAALRFASKYGHTDTVELLLDEGADVHAEYGEALRVANAYGHADTAKLLMARGAGDDECNTEEPEEHGFIETELC